MDTKNHKENEDYARHKMVLSKEDIEKISEAVAKKTLDNFFSRSTRVAAIAFFMTLFVWLWVISLAVSMLNKGQY